MQSFKKFYRMKKGKFSFNSGIFCEMYVYNSRKIQRKFPERIFKMAGNLSSPHRLLKNIKFKGINLKLP